MTETEPDLISFFSILLQRSAASGEYEISSPEAYIFSFLYHPCKTSAVIPEYWTT